MNQVGSEREDLAVVLAAHGSTLNKDSSQPVQCLARHLSRQTENISFHTAFWKEEPTFHQVLAGVFARQVVVVPYFLAEGYFTREVLPREMLAALEDGTASGHRLLFTEPIGTHPQIIDALLESAQQALGGLAPDQVDCLLVAHGTPRNKGSRELNEAMAAGLREHGHFQQVVGCYMEEEPRIETWEKLSAGGQVLVLPFFLSDGLHAREDIPAMMGLKSGQHGGPYSLRGKKLWYASSITEPSWLAPVVLDRIEAALESMPRGARA